MEGMVQEAAEAGFSLVYACEDGTRGDALPLVVVLHARGGDALSSLAEARAVFGEEPDIAALQAARPCNPFQSNLRVAPPYAGFSWYLGDDAERPEAASFGDALAQLSAFAQALPRDAVLTGSGQGGALALAAVLSAPPHVVGVHAEGSGLPRLDGWDAPAAMLGPVAFALRGLGAATRLATVAALGARGARNIDDGSGPGAQSAAAWLQSVADSRRSPRHGR